MEGKKILVIDENGFSRVCRSLLEYLGYTVHAVDSPDTSSAGCDLSAYDLLITSYPFGSSYLPQARARKSPVILLSNCISPELIRDIDDFSDLHCLIKPIDFDRFTELVKEKVEGTFVEQGGYTIV